VLACLDATIDLSGGEFFGSHASSA